MQWLDRERIIGGGTAENLVHVIDLRSQNVSPTLLLLGILIVEFFFLRSHKSGNKQINKLINKLIIPRKFFF